MFAVTVTNGQTLRSNMRSASLMQPTAMNRKVALKMTDDAGAASDTYDYFDDLPSDCNHDSLSYMESNA